jgi:S1-C subfamily serine protease
MMIRILLALLFALLLSLLFASIGSAQTAELASVRVYKFGGRDTEAANNDNLPDGSGSGWLITATQVVTAYHVVHNNRGGNMPVQVRFPDGWRSWATVQAVDLDKDIALLWINPHKTARPIPLGETPEEGIIKIHGYGYDYEFGTHTGAITSRMKNTSRNYDTGTGSTDADPEGPWNAVWAVAVPGHSGGPVMFQGKCIGSVLSITDTLSIFWVIESIKEAFGPKLRHSVLTIK